MTVSRDSIYSLLQEYSGKKDLAGGRHVHALMVGSGFDSVAVLGDHLIRLFASCESLLEANLTFCNVAEPSVFTWHSIISAHSALGESERAIELYQRMQTEGTRPDKFIYTCILKACADKGATELGMEIHDLIIRSAFESDVVVGSALIDMYSKCGGLNDACKIFCKLFSRNAISWNTLIAQCNQYGYGGSALELYGKMQLQGIKPERSTFSSILKACASVGAVDQGKLIHEQVVKSGLELDVVVGSTLVDMYSKCGNLRVAREVFEKMHDRDIVSWGAMISGYVEHGDNLSALELFARLQQEDLRPNKVVFSCVLKACASIRAVGQARQIYYDIIRSGFELDKVVGSALVDMHARCGSLEEACKVFDSLPIRDVVSWNAIIAGYVQHGHGSTALTFFMKMQWGYVRPDRITFLATLKACGIIGALGHGKVIHDQIIKGGLESNISVGSALVDTYAKCGSLGEARNLFDKLPNRNIVSWGAMIAGYTQLGYHRLVGQCLHDMTQQGLIPNATIYVNVLAACSHAGKVEDSHEYFKFMVNGHGITPSTEHFNCMIDVLGRAGRLNEAKVLLQSMPIQADITCWMSLLASCRTYGNADLGRQCFDQLVKMDPEYASGYVLISKLYADMNMWEHVSKIRELRKGLRAWKKPGMAWADVKNRAQEFIVGGNQRNSKVHFKLKTLRKAMLEVGYMPQIDSVDLGNEEDG